MQQAVSAAPIQTACTAMPITPRGRLPAGLSIRQCERSDGPALFDLFNSEGWQRDAIPEPYVSAVHVSEWIALCRDHSFLLVADVAGAVTGYGGLFLHRGARSHVGVLSLAIQEEHQGRGIGKGMLRALLATADNYVGLRRVELTVLADNMRAIALYQNFGFKIEGRHASFARRPDGEVAGLTMARVV